MIIACVQMHSTNDKGANLVKAKALIDRAMSFGAQVIVLPEFFNFRGSEEEKPVNAETIPGETSSWASTMARRTGAYLLAGSLLEKDQAGLFFNTSLLLNPSGEIIALYRKIHLFDAVINTLGYKESALIHPGDSPVVANTDFGIVGLTICYDLRFPDLYMHLTSLGAKLIFVPASFTLHTGKDHWEVLLRARAIENQVYVAAAGQIGESPAGRATYGRSMIINPWGLVLAQAQDTETVIVTDIDFEHQESIRRSLPVLHHRRSSLFVQR